VDNLVVYANYPVPWPECLYLPTKFGTFRAITNFVGFSRAITKTVEILRAITDLGKKFTGLVQCPVYEIFWPRGCVLSVGSVRLML
jgi:hypothetical protein